MIENTLIHVVDVKLARRQTTKRDKIDEDKKSKAQTPIVSLSSIWLTKTPSFPILMRLKTIGDKAKIIERMATAILGIK